MHNAWESSISKMHAIANASDSSMYISVNLLAHFFLPARARKKKEKGDKDEEGGRGRSRGSWIGEERRVRRHDLGC